MKSETVEIDRRAGGAHIRLGPPGATHEIAGRALLYAGVIGFAIWALVASGFGLIAWIATVPFAIAGGRLLYLTILYSRMRVDISIDPTRFEVRARGLATHDSVSGGSTKLKVVGPMFDQPTHYLRVLALPLVRLQYEDQELEVGHGLSEDDLRSVVRELKAYSGDVTEVT